MNDAEKLIADAYADAERVRREKAEKAEAERMALLEQELDRIAREHEERERAARAFDLTGSPEELIARGYEGSTSGRPEPPE